MKPSHSRKSALLDINAILALTLVDRPCITAKYRGYMHVNNRQPLFERLLDALAEIAVANPKEVMALAVCLHQAEGPITLYLSGNHTVSEKTVEHLKRVWSLMGSLACAFANNLTQNQEIKNLRAKLLLEIYAFCYLRFRKRFNKWCEALRGHYRKLVAYCLHLHGNVSITDGLKDVMDTSRNINSTLEYLGRIVAAHPDGLDDMDPRSAEWTDFVRLMDHLKALFTDTKILSGVFDNLEVQIDPQQRFGPAYAVQRIVSFQLLVDTICNFTESVRFPPSRYSCEIEFVILPPAYTLTLSHLSWPKTIDDWIATRNALFHSEGYEPLHEEETFTVPGVPSPHVSCECALIQYLDSDHPLGHAPSMNYIGLSKHPCYLSDLWMAMYNAFAHRGHYVMRWSDGRWPEQWVLPQIGLEMVPTFLKEVIATYCVHQAKKGKALFEKKGPS